MRQFVNYLFFVFIAVCSLGSSTLFAEQATNEANDEQTTEEKQYYIVEVILFRNLDKTGMRDEYWSRPEDQGLANSTETVNTALVTDDQPALAEYNLSSRSFLPLRKGIATLSAENYKLADTAANLRYAKDYRVLAHFGWTQRSLSKRYALPIKITSNNMTDSLLPSGDLRLYVSRFLHLQVDLAASQCVPIASPSSEDENTENTQTSDQTLDQKLAQGITPEEVATVTTSDCVNNVYRFKQNRKMRSKELHYLDNPVYGLLVYVTPFTVGGENL